MVVGGHFCLLLVGWGSEINGVPPFQVYLNGIALTKKVLLADGNKLEEKVSGNNDDNQVSNLFLCSTSFYFYCFIR